MAANIYGRRATQIKLTELTGNVTLLVIVREESPCRVDSQQDISHLGALAYHYLSQAASRVEEKGYLLSSHHRY